MPEHESNEANSSDSLSPQSGSVEQQREVDAARTRLRLRVAALCQQANSDPHVWGSADSEIDALIAAVRAEEKKKKDGAELAAAQTIPDVAESVPASDPADMKQANGDTYRRILESWQEYDACLRKISAVCWTDNDPLNERDCAANIIRHIRDLQRRVMVAEGFSRPLAAPSPATEVSSPTAASPAQKTSSLTAITPSHEQEKR